MTVRPTFRLLLTLAAITSVGACVAESGKTDTLIVKEASKAPPTKTKTPPADTTGAGTMNIRNPTYDSVTVEVRLGTSTDCAQNSAFGTRQLRKGDTWTVSTDQAVCWRRDANPNAPNGTWSAWNRQAIGKGTTHDATL